MPTLTHSTRALRFRNLSVPRQTLLRICQATHFGSIRGLEIKGGEPVFDPPPIVLVDVKLGVGEPPRSENELVDFDLAQEVVHLMDRLDQMVATTIELLEVRAGLPRRAVFRMASTILEPANF